MDYIFINFLFIMVRKKSSGDIMSKGLKKGTVLKRSCVCELITNYSVSQWTDVIGGLGKSREAGIRSKLFQPPLLNALC